jgi:hypothetical protein
MSTTPQHIKEATMNSLHLPIEVIDIIKSFTFYDIYTANEIKKVKVYKNIFIKTLNEACYSDYKRTISRELLEMDDENILFDSPAPPATPAAPAPPATPVFYNWWDDDRELRDINMEEEQQEEEEQEEDEEEEYEYSEAWIFGFLNHPYEGTFCICAQNCLKCGNYLSSIYMPENIQCNCNPPFELPEFFE